MRRRFSKYFPLGFYLTDLLLLNISFFIGMYLKFDSWSVFDQEHINLIITFNLCWSLVFYFSHLFEIQRDYTLTQSVKKVVIAIVWFIAAVSIYWVSTKSYWYSREHIFYTITLFSFSVIGWRIAFIYFLRYLRQRGFNFRNIVIVGMTEMGQELRKYFSVNSHLGYRFQGFFDPQTNRNGVVGSIKDVHDFSVQKGTDIIFCCLPSLYNIEVKNLIDFAENNLIKIKVVSDLRAFADKHMQIQNYGTIPIINISSIPLDDKVNRVVKRIFDIAVASIVMIFILSWLIPLIGMLIKIQSPGPIFFKQLRHGKNNQDFYCWKFRTMTLNVEADIKQATKGDTRITEFGKFLRRSSIDELPQFINVFRGNMSVVGPRPHPIKLNEEFLPQIDRFIQRHAVKPGVTGLAQAKGFRGETDSFFKMYGRVKLDKFYVKNWSLFLDLKIIILTVISVLRGNENAY
ncbi:MAG: undecaprenyl-phosphate glucose phosphotransferase [Bacteroidetes bacterium]|nr:undecaprenyl-phosphate glucose phosphotransferase [Bacteroidota bacterium]MDA1119632.1 undecaprenyl-phosphate glucose phosphotransferase [Bacteroidota bacterium]